MSPNTALEMARQYYHPKDAQEEAVYAILVDLSDRAGFDLDAIGGDELEQLVEDWKAIVLCALQPHRLEAQTPSVPTTEERN